MARNDESTAYLEQLPDCEPERPALLMDNIQLHTIFNTQNDGEKVVRIGRHPANDVVLESVRLALILSAFHCRIELQIQQDGEHRYTLTDMGATNGCYVKSVMIPKNGSRILEDGDAVSLGGPRNVRRGDLVYRNPFCFRFLLAPEPLPPSPSMEVLLEDLICAVCREGIVDAHILPCSHSFCGACIWTWRRRNSTCPDCRANFYQPIRNPHLENFIDLKMMEILTPEEAEQRTKRKAECVQERTRMKRTRINKEVEISRVITTAVTDGGNR
ncbi:hypothetical protein CYMTET_12560 [Cymbomonas tetramitiformis]|uniref:E3 ubiquitin-protein ligase CHFR n=1 Tax=Cymbomonas tetramitiformis TaxID=36881 RepID=A0AAE0GKD1_9CHLO|nr:hypothetical protein CYMTET_50012 [Cymbomonas tetramitiformis]KAK3279548.1 hypothetical protein CYMTET_12560 [Cymbomonas tetramitiformis]